MAYNIYNPVVVVSTGTETLTNKTIENALIVNAITAPDMPIFEAHSETDQNNVTGDGTVVTVKFDVVDVDTTGGFDPSIGHYTAFIAGNYLFSTTVKFAGIDPPSNNGILRIYNESIDRVIAVEQFNFSLVRGPGKEVTINLTGQDYIVDGQRIRVELMVSGDSGPSTSILATPFSITRFTGHLIF